jgi:hypothetical protein
MFRWLKLLRGNEALEKACAEAVDAVAEQCVRYQLAATTQKFKPIVDINNANGLVAGYSCGIVGGIGQLEAIDSKQDDIFRTLEDRFREKGEPVEISKHFVTQSLSFLCGSTIGGQEAVNKRENPNYWRMSGNKYDGLFFILSNAGNPYPVSPSLPQEIGNRFGTPFHFEMFLAAMEELKS